MENMADVLTDFIPVSVWLYHPTFVGVAVMVYSKVYKKQLLLVLMVVHFYSANAGYESFI